MFDTIVLLTGPAEQSALASVLRGHNLQLTVYAVTSLGQIDALGPALLARARLIGFVTPVVVPKRILDALGFGAYNLHPGPPHYPGWLPAHFAIHDRASVFGATAHVMTERVDAGPIVGIELFSVPPYTSVERLEELAYVHVARLFWKLAEALANQCESLAELPVRWTGRKSTRRMFAATFEMPIDVTTELRASA